MPELTVIRSPLTTDDWRSLGLDVARVGATQLETGSPGWGFSTLVGGAMPVATWVAALPVGEAPVHRSSATKVDHVVLMVPWLAAAEQSLLETLGIEPVKRSTVRSAAMAFFRVGEAVLEVVESGLSPQLWGVTLRVSSIEAAIAASAGLLGAPQPAIQGGRIASAARVWDGFHVAVREKA